MVFGLGGDDKTRLLKRLGSVPKSLDEQMALHDEVLALQAQLESIEKNLRERISQRISRYQIKPEMVSTNEDLLETRPTPREEHLPSFRTIEGQGRKEVQVQCAPRSEPSQKVTARVVPRQPNQAPVEKAPIVEIATNGWWSAIEEASKIPMSPAYILKGMLEQAGVLWERSTFIVGKGHVEDIGLVMEENMTAYHNGEQVPIDMKWTLTLSEGSDFVTNSRWVGGKLKWLGQEVAASNKGNWDYSPCIKVSSPKGQANVLVISVSLEGAFEEKDV
jgi:hypothetical protein